MLSNRAVAFLDILGFKNMLQKNPLSNIGGRYDCAIEQTEIFLRKIPERKNEFSFFPKMTLKDLFCQRFIFSDSIILFGNDHTEESTLKLLLYTRTLMQYMIATGFPLRGGIVYGEVYLNPKCQVFLGRALTDAYLLEGQQNWIGISIDKSVWDCNPLILPSFKNMGLEDYIFKHYDVPMKNKSPKRMYTINWRTGLTVKEGTRSLFHYTGIKDVDTKIDNTLLYARNIIQSRRVHIQNKEYPLELGGMYIGDSEPPFPHGDDL